MNEEEKKATKAKTTAKPKAKTTAKAKVKVEEKVEAVASEEVNLDAPEVIMPPPFLVLVALMAGIVLNWIFPLSFMFGFVGGVGFVIFGIALGVMFWSFKLFKEAGTNVSPADPSTAIVTTGPYMYSRNPIYMCFLVGFVGLSLMSDAPMMLLMVVPLYFVLDLKVIKPEEEYLSGKFGVEYKDYLEHVKRWI